MPLTFAPRVLATAMDPARRDEMGQSFVETVKQMDPMDASVLEAIRKNGDNPWMGRAGQVVAASLSYSQDQVFVSFHHLSKQDCV